MLALLAVVAGTAVGWRVALADAERDAERAADELAADAAAALENVVGRAVDGLRGANAVVGSDGVVDRAAFRAFAEGILGDRPSGVALGVRVAGPDRAGFEAVEGIDIVARRPGGATEPAPRAPEHFPIVEVVSDNPAAQRVRGLDYATDPVRSIALAEARDGGSPVLSQPTPLRPDDAIGVAIVQPLYRLGAPVDEVRERRDAFVGFVVVAYGADAIAASLAPLLPEGTAIAVADEGSALFRRGLTDDPDDLPGLARSREVMVPGRIWELTIAPAEGASTAAADAIVVAGSVAVVAVLLLLVLTWRHQRRLRAAVDAQHQSQRRSETLEGLAAQLSRSLSGVEVGEALLQQLPPFTGTTAGAVLVLDDDGQHLDLLAAHGYEPHRVAAFARLPVAEPTMVTEVVATAEPRWLTSPLAWRGDAVMSALGDVGRAAAVVPLVAERSVAGVLVLVHPGVRGFYEDERSLLLTVAALAARAIQRARRYDAEHDAAVVLQRALLPASLPKLDGAAIAVRYLPATGGPAVGGDFYDVFALPDGRIGVVVGDVVGRGVRAAAAMGRLRSALRALADLAPEPAALVRALERHVPTIPDALCATMIYVVVDPAAGTLTYVRAGHPPPVLLRADGSSELLDAAGSPPLGVTAGAGVVAVTVTVAPGDGLVLYTDGVVERRGEPVTAGLDRLRAVAESLPADPDACADRIVELMLGADGHGDDAAVVVIRVLPVPLPAAATGEGQGAATA